MNRESDPRDEALRRMLVAAADSSLTPARPRWRLAVASVSAFALAGALTGGTLATVGAAPANDSRFDAPLEIEVPPILDDDVRILGTPIVVTGREPAYVDLGPAPEGANGLALAMYCLEFGSYRTELDGSFEMGMTCTPDSESDPIGGGGGGVTMFGDTPPRVLSVDLDFGRYAVWAAWVDQPADAEPSVAQQEALSDGVVSREEYVAGFDRYVACMAALGFEVYGSNREEEIIGYAIPGSAGQSGAANRCYEAEFHLVDMEWQIAHED
jgi:hypothetical protein